MAITTNKSKYLSDAVLNWMAGTTMPAAPGTVYLALLTTMPTKNDGTSLVEVSGGSYARQPMTSATWGAITTAGDNVTEQVSNTAGVSFPAASANWGTVLGVAVYDALTNGNLLEFGVLTASQVVNSGNQFSLPVGNLTRNEN